MKVMYIFGKRSDDAPLRLGEWYEVRAIKTTRLGIYLSLSGPEFKLHAHDYRSFNSQEFAGPDGKPGSYLLVRARSGKALQVFANTPLRITHLTRVNGKCHECKVQVVRIGSQQQEQTGQMTRLFPYEDFEPSHAT